LTLTESSGGPQVLCAGIAVLDAVFGVAQFPVPEAKTDASAFMIISGGCAANAAVAIARLGGAARFAGPLGGPAGQEAIGDRIVAALAGEQVDCADCPRVPGVASSMSAICIDPQGERAIVNYRDDRLAAARPSDPSGLVATADAVLADNRFPEFVLPICEAARARGIPVVLDADKPTRATDSLLHIATHVVFSAEGLRATAGSEDPAAGLERIAALSGSFLAVTDGAHGVFWLPPGPQRKCRWMSAFPVRTIGYAGRRRRLSRRLCAGARRGSRGGRCAALCGRGGGHQVHPFRRDHRSAEAGGGRSLPGDRPGRRP
jgi:sulfofructose kinase